MKLPPFLPNQSELQKNTNICVYNLLFLLLKEDGNFYQMRQSYEIQFYVLELAVRRIFIVILPPCPCPLVENMHGEFAMGKEQCRKSQMGPEIPAYTPNKKFGVLAHPIGEGTRNGKKSYSLGSATQSLMDLKIALDIQKHKVISSLQMLLCFLTY